MKVRVCRLEGRGRARLLLDISSTLDILIKMDKHEDKLGPYLAAVRKQRGLTLREVEAATGISNPYLSQLENGKVREPSPVHLHKLSQLYGVSYATLLQLAGYPVPGRAAPPPESPIAARLGPVTKDEEEALADYLAFLRSKRSRGGR